MIVYTINQFQHCPITHLLEFVRVHQHLNVWNTYGLFAVVIWTFDWIAILVFLFAVDVHQNTILAEGMTTVQQLDWYFEDVVADLALRFSC